MKKIGMCTGESRIDDSSFIFSAWSGLKKVREELGLKTSIIESVDDSDTHKHLSYLAENGYDLVFTVGYQMAEDLRAAAALYPDVLFCGIDADIDQLLPNMVALQFREIEGAYLAGFAAASVSRSGRIGFLGGMDIPLINRFRSGYQAGAEDARPGVEIEIMYADSFLSYAKGQVIGKEMYDNGCDVIFHAAGTVGKGLIRTAKELDTLVIGADIDQSFLAPGNVLTSMLKDVKMTVFTACRQFIDGELKGGMGRSFGIKEGLVDLAPLMHDPRVPDGLEDELAGLKNRIAGGELSIVS